VRVMVCQDATITLAHVGEDTYRFDFAQNSPKPVNGVIPTHFFVIGGI